MGTMGKSVVMQFLESLMELKFESLARFFSLQTYWIRMEVQIGFLWLKIPLFEKSFFRPIFLQKESLIEGKTIGKKIQAIILR